MAKNIENDSIMNTEAEIATQEEVKPIRITFKGRTWTLDFNRSALDRIKSDDDLLEALEIDPKSTGGMVKRLAKWLAAMPRVMVIASAMYQVPPMPLSTAEDIFKEAPKKADLCARINSLYVQRLSEFFGMGNEDLVEDNNQGNVSWE